MTTGEQAPDTAPPAGDVAEAMAQIEKGQQMAGHFPNKEALERARRILTGEMTRDEAITEIKAKYVQR